MPFISQDWRGPGEDWVKVDDGWEIKKVSVMERDGVKRRRTKTEGDRGEEVKNAVIRLIINKLTPSQNIFIFIRLERHRSLPSLQPFCPIVTKCTREVVGFNSLADVLKRLDFRSAVHDIRRFQYVAAIMKHLVVAEKFYQLSGASQIFIFRSVNVSKIETKLFIYLFIKFLFISPH